MRLWQAGLGLVRLGGALRGWRGRESYFVVGWGLARLGEVERGWERLDDDRQWWGRRGWVRLGQVGSGCVYRKLWTDSYSCTNRIIVSCRSFWDLTKALFNNWIRTVTYWHADWLAMKLAQWIWNKHNDIHNIYMIKCIIKDLHDKFIMCDDLVIRYSICFIHCVAF